MWPVAVVGRSSLLSHSLKAGRWRNLGVSDPDGEPAPSSDCQLKVRAAKLRLIIMVPLMHHVPSPLPIPRSKAKALTFRDSGQSFKMHLTLSLQQIKVYWAFGSVSDDNYLVNSDSEAEIIKHT